ncbi:sugar phosphate isomerase/epimerase family protein [Hwanghaeella sp.]|uniref:sugar phosphate isomerase/epimerase family protein n=1 Tax=Hwanghaeella sp. TaxID=2605943 RepID=UPI003CCBEB2D
MATDGSDFAINLYSYLFSHTAADAVRHLSDQGYSGFEFMMFPNHLWYGAEHAATAKDLLAAQAETGARFLSSNMPNIDINIAACDPAMRDYSLNTLTALVELSGDLGIPRMIVGPGKPNPLFPAPRDFMMDCFFKGLDRLVPVAERAGVMLLIENMPFAFLPDADGMMEALDTYGHDGIGITYDVANGHFIKEDITAGMKRVQSRLQTVHLSDTTQHVYKHDAVGLGDVDFRAAMQAMKNVGYTEQPILEIIDRNPDPEIARSAEALAALSGI